MLPENIQGVTLEYSLIKMIDQLDSVANLLFSGKVIFLSMKGATGLVFMQTSC